MRKIIWIEQTKSKAGRQSKKKKEKKRKKMQKDKVKKKKEKKEKRKKDAKRLSHHRIMQYIVHRLTKPNSTTNSLL